MGWLNIKAVILAAGQGTRLMPYTKGIPKCMVRVNDHPLIQYQINVLTSLGINDIIIVRGHQGKKINFPNVRYYENNEYKITNMVYSLF